MIIVKKEESDDLNNMTIEEKQEKDKNETNV